MEVEVWKVWKKTQRTLWEVSSFGNVKMNGQLYVLKKGNYCMISGGGSYVHIAVGELFIPKPAGDGPWEIDHIDGDPWNNRVDNLRWVTHRENCNNPITRKRKSEAQKGKHPSEESRAKMSKSKKGRHHYNNGIIEILTFECPPGFQQGRLKKSI